MQTCLHQENAVTQTDPTLKPLLDLDRLVHEPARLALLTVLEAAEEVEFLFLERVTGLSKGNLSSHAQKLEAAGYVEIRKNFRGRIPVTFLRATQTGRLALQLYHQQMMSFLSKGDRP